MQRPGRTETQTRADVVRDNTCKKRLPLEQYPPARKALKRRGAGGMVDDR